MENKRRTILIILAIIILVVIFSLVLFITKDNKENKITDQFKEEYESLNDSYVKVNLLYDNKFIYKKESDIINLMKKTGIIYFGNSKSNDCRVAVNILQHINANKIYYINTNNIDDYKSTLNMIDDNLEYDKNKPLVVGVKDGAVVGYHAGIIGEIVNEKISKDQEEELKKIYDEINTKVYNDTCDIDEPEGC